MALAMTGRVADGLILQLADPDLIRWMVGIMREAAEEAGRDPASIKVQAAAPAHVGTIRSAVTGSAGSRPSSAATSWIGEPSIRAKSCRNR